MSDVTESDRELARRAMIKGYHDCGARWQAGPGRSCDCDDSRIDGCKARVDAIAASIREQQTPLLAALKMLREIDDAYGFDLDEPQRDQMHDAIAKAEGSISSHQRATEKS